MIRPSFRSGIAGGNSAPIRSIQNRSDFTGKKGSFPPATRVNPNLLFSLIHDVPLLCTTFGCIPFRRLIQDQQRRVDPPEPGQRQLLLLASGQSFTAMHHLL